MYYRYAQKWVDLFKEMPNMQRVETGHFIRGYHSLLNAHFDLRNYRELSRVLKEFEAFSQTKRVQDNENFTVQSFVYIASAKINFYNITGLCEQGLKVIPEIEQKLKEYELFLDKHRIMVITYKIAMLYYLSGDYSTSIDYLQRIINDCSDLRTDLQCYSRLMHLLAQLRALELENGRHRVAAPGLLRGNGAHDVDFKCLEFDLDDGELLAKAHTVGQGDSVLLDVAREPLQLSDQRCRNTDARLRRALIAKQKLGVGPTLVFLANEIGDWHANLVEENFIGFMVAVERDQRPHRDARAAHVNEQE